MAVPKRGHKERPEIACRVDLSYKLSNNQPGETNEKDHPSYFPFHSISQSSFRKMTVREAVNSLNGTYEPLPDQESSRCSKLLIEIDASLNDTGKKPLVVHHLSFNQAYPTNLHTNKNTKVFYDTKNRGKTAFLKFKNSDIFSTFGGDYGGTLVNRRTNTAILELDQNSKTLRFLKERLGSDS